MNVNDIYIPEIFNTKISHQLFDYTITFVNSLLIRGHANKVISLVWLYYHSLSLILILIHKKSSTLNNIVLQIEEDLVLEKMKIKNVSDDLNHVFDEMLYV